MLEFSTTATFDKLFKHLPEPIQRKALHVQAIKRSRMVKNWLLGAVSLASFALTGWLWLSPSEVKATDQTLTDARKPNTTESSFVVGPGASKNIVFVFIHGIFGDAQGTWYNKHAKKYFYDLMKVDPIYKGADVFVYGFPSSYWGTNAWSIQTAVADLDQTLRANNVDGYKQIVIVAHSMGGLVAEQYLLTFRKIARKVPLLFLFSTPQEGSPITKIARFISSNSGIEAMIPGDKNIYLADLDYGLKAAREDGSINTQVRCAYETLPTFGQMIVGQSSATRLCAGVSAPVDADHINIVKPSASTHRSYQALKNAYQSIARVTSQDEEVTRLNVTGLSSPGRMRPLDGFPVTLHDSGPSPVFGGGVKLSFSLSHNQKSSHSIIVKGLQINIHQFRPGLDKQYAYAVKGDKIVGAGVAKPHEFRATLAGSDVKSAKWILDRNKHVYVRNRDLFDYDDVSYIVLSDTDDVEEIIGTVRAEKTGFYDISFTFTYSVDGQDKELNSEHIFIYRHDKTSDQK